MIITKEKILKEVKFQPVLDVFQVNPHSVDIRLASDVILPPYVHYRPEDVARNDMRIGVDSHVLGKSMEAIILPSDIMAVVYPRSSTNRRGITLDMTGVVDAGYSGHLTLPFTNWTMQKIVLKRGERVASLVFHRLEEPVTPRLSKYHNSNGEYIPDKSEESKLVETGGIEYLKENYRYEVEDRA